MKKNMIIYGAYDGIQIQAIKHLTQILLDTTVEHPICVSADKYVEDNECRHFFIGTKESNPYVKKLSDKELHREIINLFLAIYCAVFGRYVFDLMCFSRDQGGKCPIFVMGSAFFKILTCCAQEKRLILFDKLLFAGKHLLLLTLIADPAAFITGDTL